MICSTGSVSGWGELWCRPVTGALDASVLIPPRDGGSLPNNVAQMQEVVVCRPTADAAGGGGCNVAAISGKPGSEPFLPAQRDLFEGLTCVGMLWLARRKRA